MEDPRGAEILGWARGCLPSAHVLPLHTPAHRRWDAACGWKLELCKLAGLLSKGSSREYFHADNTTPLSHLQCSTAAGAPSLGWGT